MRLVRFCGAGGREDPKDPEWAPFGDLRRLGGPQKHREIRGFRPRPSHSGSGAVTGVRVQVPPFAPAFGLRRSPTASSVLVEGSGAAPLELPSRSFELPSGG